MPALKLAKTEHFARNLAQGMNQTQAAIQAGYSESRAASQGCKLAKKPEIIARVDELKARVEQQFIISAVVSKEWWIQGIQHTMEQARDKEKYSDVLKGYELIGKHLRLLDRAAENIDWNGDLGSLTDQQLEYVMACFEKLVPADRLEAAKQRAALEAGTVIDVVPEQSTETPVVENKAPDEW